jgi:hypothetical protein
MKLNCLKLLTLVAIFALASCSKDDDPSTVELLKSDKGWILTALVTDPAYDIFGTQVTDLYAQFEACAKDDLYFFQDDNKYLFDEGATKCDPTDPQTDTGTWLLSTDEKVMTVDGESWDIIEINKNTLKVKYVYSEGGLNYTWTSTFEHP